jgi:hypothetical protein
MLSSKSDAFASSKSELVADTNTDIKKLNTFSDKVTYAFSEVLIPFLSSFSFGLGLGYSGMLNSEKVVTFLDFMDHNYGWDYTLAGVMGGGVLFNLISRYLLVKKQQKVILSSKSISDIVKFGNVKENLRIDKNLILGSLMFGIGWGMTGMCPAPALVSFGGMQSVAGPFVISMIWGMFLQDLINVKSDFFTKLF